jgi:hypothetical protein
VAFDLVETAFDLVEPAFELAEPAADLTKPGLCPMIEPPRRIVGQPVELAGSMAPAGGSAE